MTRENPYSSPNETPADAAPSPGILLRSVAVVFGSALVGGLIGLGIGAALGWLVPGYYRSVFPGGSDPNFDPLAVGIGQGLTQGVALGGIIGLALVALWYWFRGRPASRRSR